MRTWTWGPVVLLSAVAMIVATGACLVHPDDDGAPDVCASLLAVTLAVTLAFAPDRTPATVVTRLDGHRPFALEPPAPPPKA